MAVSLGFEATLVVVVAAVVAAMFSKPQREGFAFSIIALLALAMGIRNETV